MHHLTRWLTHVSAVALALIVLITVADVALANLARRPIIGAIEMVETALAFMFFLGIGEVFRGEHNITVDVSDHFVSPRTRDRLRLLGAVLAVVFLVLMIVAMSGPAGDAWRFGDSKADSGIPLVVLWVPALAGTAIAIIAAVHLAVRLVRARLADRP